MPVNSSKPNILIIFTDMQRADTIHALGNRIIRTPHLDRIVREGTSFSNCFSPSPVCVPARCCMHYGMYPQHTGLFDNGRMMDDNGKSYADVLGRNGYRTHAVGKCHFTPDHSALRGFQSRQIQEEIQSNPDLDDYIAWLKNNKYDDYEQHGARGDMYYIPQISTLPAEAHPSQWIGNESEKFIRSACAEGKQWCLFSSFIHPHPPFTPPKPWHKLYRVSDMPVPFIPDNRLELQTWVNRYQNRYKYRDRGLDLNLLRLITAYYYATISFVDFQIGRILTTLESVGQLDNTMILFTSDHGEHLGDLGCFGKRSMHDASARVPMLIRYPARFPEGCKCNTAVSLCDLFPTVIGIANTDTENLNLDGCDLCSVVKYPDPERTVFSQYAKGAAAIYMAVNSKWKYVYSAGDNLEFLFDRLTDPKETCNQARVKSSKGIRDDMKMRLLRFLESTSMTDAYTIENGELDWREYPKIDEKYLANPDECLLFQDYPSYPMNLPGYSNESVLPTEK